MLRIAVPQRNLSTTQLRTLARMARDFDKGYVHFTTRQNLRLNWPQLKEVPDILEKFAKVEIHRVQTSDSYIRNITSDQYAGVAAYETYDTRS